MCVCVEGDAPIIESWLTIKDSSHHSWLSRPGIRYFFILNHKNCTLFYMYCTSLFNTLFCLLPFGNMHGELVARGGGGGGCCTRGHCHFLSF